MSAAMNFPWNSVVVFVFLGLAGIAVAEEPDRPVQSPLSYAFLFGESIPKKLEPGEQPGTGINVERIEWWIGDPASNKLRRLENPKTGRLRVRPVDRTVILKRDDASVTLLGPDGGDLVLSLKDGPLAKTELNDPIVLVTTFSFTPDGKSVVFVNKAGAICRFAIGSKELIVIDNSAIDPSEGISFSRDGSRMLYDKYFRANDFVQPVISIHVANSDGTGEKKLTEYKDGEQLGSGFLSDGRVGVVGSTMIRAFDPKTGKAETVAGPWKDKLEFRSFGGFNPDGSTFLFDVGGPYELRLFAMDIAKSTVSTVKRRYLESFQSMVWVQVLPTKP